MARILVCDDSHLMRKKICDILKEENHQIVGEASNGSEAFDKFMKLKPDLVTMDMLMDPDGHEAIKRIISKCPTAKIIIITSIVNGQGEVSETVRLGGKEFVSKPIHKEELIAKVRQVLEG